MNNIDAASDAYFSVRQVMTNLGISRTTVYRWVQQDILPKPVKLGRSRIGFPVLEVRTKLASRPRVEPNLSEEEPDEE